MLMTLTLGQIEELNIALSNIVVKGKTNLTLALNMLQLQNHIKALTTAKDNLIKEYVNEGETSISQSHPKWQSFWNEYSQILKQEVEIRNLEPIEEEKIDFNKGGSQNNFLVLLNYGLIKFAN